MLWSVTTGISSCIADGPNTVIIDRIITEAERIQRGLSALVIAHPDLQMEMIALQRIIINLLHVILNSLRANATVGLAVPYF